MITPSIENISKCFVTFRTPCRKQWRKYRERNKLGLKDEAFRGGSNSISLTKKVKGPGTPPEHFKNADGLYKPNLLIMPPVLGFINGLQ